MLGVDSDGKGKEGWFKSGERGGFRAVVRCGVFHSILYLTYGNN